MASSGTTQIPRASRCRQARRLRGAAVPGPRAECDPRAARSSGGSRSGARRDAPGARPARPHRPHVGYECTLPRAAASTHTTAARSPLRLMKRAGYLKTDQPEHMTPSRNEDRMPGLGNGSAGGACEAQRAAASGAGRECRSGGFGPYRWRCHIHAAQTDPERQPVGRQAVASVASAAGAAGAPARASVAASPASTTPSPPGVSGICPSSCTAL